MNKSYFEEVIQQTDAYKRYGKIHRVVGLMIESKGPEASIGEVCMIHSPARGQEPMQAEVVGFHNENILLMPYQEVIHISPGSLVEASGDPMKIHVGRGLIGSVLDASGPSTRRKPAAQGIERISYNTGTSQSFIKTSGKRADTSGCPGR